MTEPIWIETISIKKAVTLGTFQEQRDAIVSAFTQSAWLETEDEDGAVLGALTRFSECSNWGEANEYLAALYDFADRDGVWIETF